jgi:hypothetical protein
MVGHDDAGSSVPAPSLPAARAFVLQFNTDTLVSANRFAGRVEHIESGRCRRFATLEELMAFVSSYLDEPEP